jgi:hypothetical protein
MDKKLAFKPQYAAAEPPTPFTGLDYLLCGIAFVLLAVASLPQIAALIAPR